jgi:hypothetical protein
MIERLNKIRKFMEMNVEKTKVKRISGQSSPVQIMIERNKAGKWSISAAVW